MSLMATARFKTTVVALEQLPPVTVPEVCFVGRSNAGKSSVINALANHRALAYSSRTPGRTQALNFFELGYSQHCDGYLVDTPGYGYAEVGIDHQAEWRSLAGQYLILRESLAGVVLVADARRGLTALDTQLIEWIGLGPPLLILLNKSDKLSRQEQMSAIRDIQHQTGQQIRAADIQLFSAVKKVGVDATEAWIASKLGLEPRRKESPACRQ